MAKTIFEQNGGTYALGDYELPALKLPSEEEIHVGIWGQRYKRWLKETAVYVLQSACLWRTERADSRD